MLQPQSAKLNNYWLHIPLLLKELYREVGQRGTNLYWSLELVEQKEINTHLELSSPQAPNPQPPSWGHECEWVGEVPLANSCWEQRR